MKTMLTLKKVFCFTLFAPLTMLIGCADLAFVTPTHNQVVTTPVTPGTTTADVPIEIDFTGSTRARNIVLDGNLNITTAPAAGFTTTAGGGQNGWDRIRGKYPMSGGTHSLTASADFTDYTGATKSISKTVQFKVISPLPDLEATISSSVPTFNGATGVDFDVYIHNLGPAPANNFSVEIFTNLPAGMNSLRADSGFACRGLSGFGQALHLVCSGGSIAANQAGHIAVSVRPTNILSSGTTFTLFGYLDQPPTLDEANENNNAFTKAVIVVP